MPLSLAVHPARAAHPTRQAGDREWTPWAQRPMITCTTQTPNGIERSVPVSAQQSPY